MSLSRESLSGGASSAQLSADLAQMDSAEALSAVHHLELQVNRLFLISEALWQCLKEQHGYTDEALHARVRNIDLADGVLNGHTQRHDVLRCPKCQRIHANRNQLTCLYCGTEMLQNVFEQV
jgi:hypothetical protein